jgi:hypothetical protein
LALQHRSSMLEVYPIGAGYSITLCRKTNPAFNPHEPTILG